MTTPPLEYLVVGSRSDGSQLIFPHDGDSRRIRRAAECQARRVRALLRQYPQVDLIGVDVWVIRRRVLPRLVEATGFTGIE